MLHYKFMDHLAYEYNNQKILFLVQFQSAVYLTRSSADKHLGRETKQQFILDSQSDVRL